MKALANFHSGKTSLYVILYLDQPKYRIENNKVEGPSPHHIMQYTQERLDDGSLRVTIWNTPFGDITASVSKNEQKAVHKFRVRDRQSISIECSAGRIKSVKWDDWELHERTDKE